MNHPNYTVPPGDFLDEWLDEERMTQEEAARRLGYSRKHVNDIVHGRAKIDADTALRISRLTGIPQKSWLDYESLYRSDLSRLRDESELAQHIDKIPSSVVSYLRSKKYTRATMKNPGRIVSDFLDFHGYGTWDAYIDNMARERRGEYALAARKESVKNPVDETAVQTWLRMGELREEYEEARNYQYNQPGLVDLLPELKRRAATPDSGMLSDLTRMLSEVGVLLMHVEPPKKFPIHGTTRWIDGDKTPVIQLTGRRNSDGFFIMTLFHEIGHILNDPRGETHLEFKSEKSRRTNSEKSANKFARDLLFGMNGVDEFSGLTSDIEITQKSTELGISPGVAVCEMHRCHLLSRDRGNRLLVNLF